MIFLEQKQHFLFSQRCKIVELKAVQSVVLLGAHENIKPKREEADEGKKEKIL